MKKVTSELHRKELFRKSNFSGNSVVIPYTSEGALFKLKKLEAIETRQEISEGTNNLVILQEGTISQNGVTVNIENGVAKASGTNELNETLSIKIGTAYLMQGKTYYYTKETNKGGAGTYFVHDGQKWFEGGKEKSFVATSSVEVAIYLSVGANQTVDNQTKLLISKTSGDTWVQGKKQIPSLEYPAEVECVGDNLNELEQGSIASANGNNLTSNQRVRTKDYIRVIENTECTIDADNVDEVVVFQYDENETKILATSWLELPYSFILDKNTRYIRYAFRCSDDSVLTVDEVKDKSEYLSSVEITTSNKNLVKINENDFELIENGIKNKGRNSGVELTRLKVKKGEKIVVSLTLKSKPTKDTSIVCSINNIDVHDNSFYTLQTLELNKRFTREITLEENTEIVYRMWGNANSDIFEFQFSTSLNEATDYVEHHSKTLIMPIQQPMLKGDYFDIENKKEVHNWLELVLDEENLAKLRQASTDTEGFYRYILTLQETIKHTDIPHEKGYCTHFSTTVEAGTLHRYTGFTVSQSNEKSTLYIYDEGETLEEFKAKIQNEQVKFYLQLEEPIVLDCTEEQSIILSELESMTTYDDKTIIMIDNDMAEMTIEAEQSRMSMLEEITRKENEIICENS